MYSVANKGTWPETWPWPLEGLRDQARTLEHNAEVIYEIPFADRQEFEAKWPFLLSVKSKHAPLVLLGGPNTWLGTTIQVGVRLHCPLTGHLVTPGGTIYRPGAETAIKDGKFLKIGPPWPDGKWKAQDPKKLKRPIFFGLWRARTDIDLIVDGKIVDLNRIPLPADTPIVDKRFAAKK
jgi:hypothetical protein